MKPIRNLDVSAGGATEVVWTWKDRLGKYVGEVELVGEVGMCPGRRGSPDEGMCGAVAAAK